MLNWVILIGFLVAIALMVIGFVSIIHFFVVRRNYKKFENIPHMTDLQKAVNRNNDIKLRKTRNSIINNFENLDDEEKKVFITKLNYFLNLYSSSNNASFISSVSALLISTTALFWSVIKDTTTAENILKSNGGVVLLIILVILLYIILEIIKTDRNKSRSDFFSLYLNIIQY